jgi:hypothetical protein
MHDLAALVPHGAVHRDQVTLASSSTSVARWLAEGDLVLLHPGVVGLPTRAREWDVRARAATLWTRGPLSHASALVHLGLLPRDTAPAHVTVPADRWPRGAAGVVAHRTTLPMEVADHGGLPVLGLARSLVDAWSWASSTRLNPRAAADLAAVRAVVVAAVRDGHLLVAQVRAESAAQRIHAGRVALGKLLDLVEQGCQSELEIFGVLHVLGHPSLPKCTQQHRVTLLDGRRVRLDAAWLGLRVAVEMDGHRFHSSRADRERDMRRDTGLAALGWIVLRFSYRRLTTDPDGCRREIAAVLRRRALELGMAL